MNQNITGLTIFDVANNCSNLFAEYLSSPVSTQKVIAEELQARFSLWTAYTGAFADHGASLDDRLIFHEDVKRMVITLLYMVQRNIKNALDQDLRAQDCRIISSWESSTDLSKFLASGGASFSGLTAVSAALDRLHRLATAIRRSSVESRKDKLFTKNWKTEGDSYLEEGIFRFVKERFPSTTRTSLLEQLTAALCFNRKRLLYLPRHNRKLANKTKRDSHFIATEFQLRSLLFERSRQKETDLSLADIAHRFTMSNTDASIPDSRLRRALVKPPRSPMTVASTGSAIQGEVLDYPVPPKFGKDEKYLSCPYCSEPLPTLKLDMEKRINVEFWRDHINQDLEPYFCIAEECREPLKFFDHFQSWLQHMEETHTYEWYRTTHMMTWYCDIEHTPQMCFNDKKAFEAHTAACHSMLTPSQLVARSKRSKAVAYRPPFTCPICESVPRKLAPLVPQQQQPEEISNLVGKHVAVHIKALSLLAFRLLPYDENDDTGEYLSDSLDTASLNVRNKTSQSESRTELDSDARLLETSEDIPDTGSSKNETEFDIIANDAPPELELAEAWDFIPIFQKGSNFVQQDLNADREHALALEEELESDATYGGQPIDRDTGLPQSMSKDQDNVQVAQDLEARRTRSVSSSHKTDIHSPVGLHFNQKWLLPPQKPEFREKKCLIIDLFETLVHSSYKILHQADFTVPVEIEGQYHNSYVIKRPGVDVFLKRVGELFEVVIFSEESAKETDPIIDQLDIYNSIQYRLFKESCYNHQGDYVKDLSMLGRDLAKTMIIDNSATSYLFHPQYAIPISSWFSDAHDNELLDMIPFLEDLAKDVVQDVSLSLDISL